MSLGLRHAFTRRVFVHRDAGLRRSALVAGAVMVARGTDPPEAVEPIRAMRPEAPSDTDAEWLLSTDTSSQEPRDHPTPLERTTFGAGSSSRPTAARCEVDCPPSDGHVRGRAWLRRGVYPARSLEALGVLTGVTVL